MERTSSSASTAVYSGAVEQYSLYRVDRGRLSKDGPSGTKGSSGNASWAAGRSLTDALEVNDFPELSDVLSVPVAAVLSGERSRIPGSKIVGPVGGCSSSRGLVRSLAMVSVPSDSEAGDRGRFWEWTSVSIPGGSCVRPLIGEVGRGRVSEGTDPKVGTSVSVDGVCPETTPAKVRGLEGGVVDIVVSLGAAGGTTVVVTVGPEAAGVFWGHFLASWPVLPHQKHDLIWPL